MTSIFPSHDRALFLKEARVRLKHRSFLLEYPAQHRDALVDAAMLGVSAALFSADGADVANVAHYCVVPSRRALLGVMRAMASAESGFRRASGSGAAGVKNEGVTCPRDETAIRSKIVRFAKRVNISPVRVLPATR